MSTGDTGDAYGYGDEELEWFQRFEVRPMDPAEVSRRLDDGAALVTTDAPEYLARPLTVEIDSGLGLYRLVQLFGTPNVPPLMAGGDQPGREVTTWQYVFEVTYDAEDDEDAPEEFLLAVYDYKTDISTGLASFVDREAGPAVQQPGREPHSDVELPDDEFLVGVVQLVLNMVEEPVPATFKELWV